MISQNMKVRNIGRIKMDYGPKEAMKEDILWILRVMVCDIFRYRLIRGILVVLVVTRFISISTELYFFMLEPRDFFKYGPHFLQSSYSLVSGAFVIWTNKLVQAMWENFERWDISSAGQDQENMIRKQLKLLNIFIIINSSIGLIDGVLVLVPGDYEEDFFFFPFIVLRWFPYLRNYSTVVILLYKLNVIGLSFSMMVHPYLLIYAVQHAKFQIILCMFFITNTDSDFEGVPDDVLAVSVLFQSTINERIMFCIRRHNEFWRWGSEARRNMTGPEFMVVTFLSFVMGFAIIFAFIQMNRYGNSKLLFWAMVLYAVVVATTFASIIYAGELIQNELENVEKALVHVKWYVWNCDNRKLFMQISAAFNVPFKLAFSGKYALNYDLAVAMLKGLYTITSVFISVVKH